VAVSDLYPGLATGLLCTCVYPDEINQRVSRTLFEINKQVNGSSKKSPVLDLMNVSIEGLHGLSSTPAKSTKIVINVLSMWYLYVFKSGNNLLEHVIKC